MTIVVILLIVIVIFILKESKDREKSNAEIIGKIFVKNRDEDEALNFEIGSGEESLTVQVYRKQGQYLLSWVGTVGLFDRLHEYKFDSNLNVHQRVLWLRGEGEFFIKDNEVADKYKSDETVISKIFKFKDLFLKLSAPQQELLFFYLHLLCYISARYFTLMNP
jgi:hypothetical protein